MGVRDASDAREGMPPAPLHHLKAGQSPVPDVENAGSGGGLCQESVNPVTSGGVDLVDL
jgi:hypothetical protein